MRRFVATACAALPFSLLLLTGCSGSSEAPATQNSSAGATSTAASTAPTKAQPVSSVNPCVLVTSTDLRRTFSANSVEQVTADGVDPSNPPVVGDFGERNCSYIVSVPGIYGDNPNEDTGAQFTITVTTNEDGEEVCRLPLDVIH